MAFSSILGQEKAVGLLRQIWARKLYPTFLFLAGPEGVGKKKAALEYAKALLCQAPVGDDGGCGQCESCLKIGRGSHPDVLQVDFSYQERVADGPRSRRAGIGGSSLRIDTIREALKLLELRPFSGRHSICVLDSAEALTLQAQNALLKILEESPRHLIWIWLAVEEGLLLSTVVSRANFRIHFKPLGNEVVERLLQEELHMGEPQAKAISSLSLGSMERARRVAELGTGLLEDQKGFSPWEALSLSQRIARFRSFASARLASMDFLEELKLRSLAAWRLKGDCSALKALALILNAQKDLDSNLSPPLVLEHLLLQMSVK